MAEDPYAKYATAGNASSSAVATAPPSADPYAKYSAAGGGGSTPPKTVTGTVETGPPPKWYQPGGFRSPDANQYRIPPGTAIQGSPVLPMGAVIPSAIGYGVSKFGEHEGLPGWASTGAGLVAGGLAGGAQSLIGKMRSLPPENIDKVSRAVTDLIPWAGGKLNKLRDAFTIESRVAPGSATGGYSRPDYSGIIQPPGSGVPPYQSSITPEPGFRTNAVPELRNPPVAPLRPSVSVPWLDESPSESIAPAPHPLSYVAVPDKGNLIEPWKPPTVVPSALTSTNPGSVTFGKSYQTPTNSPITGGSTTVTPGQIPELMRQIRLNSAPTPGAAPVESPIVAPRGVTGASERLSGPDVAPPPVTPSSTADVLQRANPDYSEVTKTYQPSRTRARFDKSGKRIGG